MSYVTEKEVREALKEPDGFSGELAENWSIGPVVGGRDFDSLRDQVNIDVLKTRLEQVPGWQIIHCGHWGHGWVEHLTFKVIEPIETELDAKINAFMELTDKGMNEAADLVQAKLDALIEDRNVIWTNDVAGLREEFFGFRVTKAAQVIFDWADEVREFVVLDEEMLGGLELDGALENIVDIARDVAEDAPDDWSVQVYEWLRHHYPSEVEAQHDGSAAYPSTTRIQEALEDLGLIEEEEP